MRAASAIVFALTLSACAADDGAPGAAASLGGQCFNADAPSTYSHVGRETLIIRAGPSGTYRAEVLLCPDLEWSREVAFRGRSGQSFVCSALDAELVITDRERRQTCLLSGLTRISEAQAAALPTAETRFFRPWRPERPPPRILRRRSFNPAPAPEPPAAP